MRWCRWALMHELRGQAESSLDDLISRLQRCDLVLIEGFKQGDFPKLEVWRACLGVATLWPHQPGIVGMASDGSLPVPPNPAPALPALPPLSDIGLIADFALEDAIPI